MWKSRWKSRYSLIPTFLLECLPESTLQAGPCVVVLEVLCLLAPEGLQSEESLVSALTEKAMAKSLSQYVQCFFEMFYFSIHLVPSQSLSTSSAWQHEQTMGNNQVEKLTAHYLCNLCWLDARNFWKYYKIIASAAVPRCFFSKYSSKLLSMLRYIFFVKPSGSNLLRIL